MDKIKIIVVEDNIVYCEFVCNLPLTGTSWFQTCAYLTAMVSTCCVGCAKRV